MRNLSGQASEVLFVVAAALAVLAIWEKLANLVGTTLLFVFGYTPARLFELAAVALLFVIAIELRRIAAEAEGPGQP